MAGDRSDRPTLLSRFLTAIERVGNALPHPATLFALFALGLIVLSWLATRLGLAAVNPMNGSEVLPINLISKDGLHWILEHTITNFTGFAPLGTVLVAMLGIGVAEKSGLMNTGLRLLVHSAPRRLLTFMIVLAGVMSNMASDVGYVLLVPLGAIIFLSVGRHPIAGLAAAFAGVSGGFSANLLLGTIDPLLAGISQEAARIIDPSYTVSRRVQLLLHGRVDLSHRRRRHLGDREDRRATSRRLERGRGSLGGRRAAASDRPRETRPLVGPGRQRSPCSAWS